MGYNSGRRTSLETTKIRGRVDEDQRCGQSIFSHVSFGVGLHRSSMINETVSALSVQHRDVISGVVMVGDEEDQDQVWGTIAGDQS